MARTRIWSAAALAAVFATSTAHAEVAKDLCRLVEARCGVVDSANGMLRLRHDLGLSWQKARPIHPGADLRAQARVKQNSRA